MFTQAKGLEEVCLLLMVLTPRKVGKKSCGCRHAGIKCVEESFSFCTVLFFQQTHNDLCDKKE